MSKLARSFVFISTGLLTLLFSVALFFAYFYSIQQDQWLLSLATVRFFYVPLIAYIIVAALIVATVVTSIFLSRFASTGLTYGEPITIFSFRTV